MTQVKQGSPHSLSQQVPSAHEPDAQSSGTSQACPSLLLQAPAGSQVSSPVHWGSSSASVTAVQAPVTQVKQGSVQSLSQQAPSAHEPDAHSKAPRQGCPTFFLQAPASSQVLLPLHCGSSSESVTGSQAPVAHEKQGSPQRDSQQAPSTQKPSAHS